MQLTEEQKKTVKQWSAEGCGLSEIQKRLSQEMGVSLTYMDVRLLVIDLGLDIRNKAGESAAQTARKAAEAAASPEEDAEEDDGGGGSEGGFLDRFRRAGRTRKSVSIEVDRIVKPGAMVSGSVTFSDGVKGSWWMDETGRLAVDAGPKYRPTPEDIQSFQSELRAVFQKRGMM